MLKEKYLKDFDIIDQTKPKGQKILTSFKNELKQIFDDFKRQHILGDFPSERVEAELYESTTFYNELSRIHETIHLFLKNDEKNKLIIYKNVYDDVFIYLSQHSKEESKKALKEAPPLSEYIFLLDEKNKIKKNDDDIAYINSHRTAYSYFKRGYVSSYKLYFVSKASCYSIDTLKEGEKYKKAHYSTLKTEENKSLYYSICNSQHDFQHVRFNDYDKQEMILVDKCINQHVDNATLSHRIEDYRIDYEISKNKISITLSKEDHKEYYHETFLMLEKNINILDEKDSFQLNNYDYHYYKDMDSFIDICMLERDIEVDKKDFILLKNITQMIPKNYEFIKSIYLNPTFNPEKIFANYKNISNTAFIKKAQRIKND